MEDEYVKVTGTEINEKCSHPVTPMTAIASSTRSDSPTLLSQSPSSFTASESSASLLSGDE